MMKKNIGINGLFYFLYIFGSCFIVMLAESLFINVVEKFVALPYPVLTVIRIVIYTAGVVAILAVAGRQEGYREGFCFVGGTVASGAIATVIHLLFSMLFHYQGFVSGSVRFTAGLVFNGWGVTYDSLINDTPYWGFLATYAAYAVLYVAVFTLAKYLGAQKRIMDRAELRRGEDTREETALDGNDF
jgi:hypothetical protein